MRNPAWLIVRAVRRRSGWLKPFLISLGTLALAASAFEFFWMNDPREEYLPTREGRIVCLLIALAGTPVLVLIGLIVKWIVHRRWLRLGSFVAFSLFLAAILVGVLLAIDSRNRDPLQHYIWGVWQIAWLAFLGTYFAAALGTLGRLFGPVLRLMRKRMAKKE